MQELLALQAIYDFVLLRSLPLAIPARPDSLLLRCLSLAIPARLGT